MTNDTDLMRELFDRATDSGPATAAIDRLVYCHLLDRITSGHIDVAIESFANPGSLEAAMAELQALNDDERQGSAAP